MVKSHISKYKKTQGENALSSNDMRAAWKFIKQATNLKTTTTKPSVSLDDLNKHFAHNSSSTAPENWSGNVASCSIQNGFSLQVMSTQSISHQLLRINGKTSTGPDGLPAKFLKKTAVAIAPNIAKIFNTSIVSGRFPDSWKQANITAIYGQKSGNCTKRVPRNF